jgi:hypothetical protein
MKRSAWVWGPAGLGIALGAWLWWKPRPAVPENAAARAASELSSGASSLSHGSDVAKNDGPQDETSRLRASPSSPIQQSAGTTAAAGVASVQGYAGPLRDRARADEVRQALAALYAGQLEAETDPPSQPSGMPAPDGTGNQANKALGAYVNRVMHEQFLPLASSCYEALLESQPRAQGNVELRFSVMGDQAVGGVVVDVALGDGTTLSDNAFATCIHESMYSVVFDPPPPGHPTLTVTQSFELSP